jgi:glycosyltransferase involved in cell wall biosynthesis
MNEALKGLVILPQLYGGGAERTTINILTGLSKKGFLMALCCLKQTPPEFAHLEEELRDSGISVQVLGTQKKINIKTLWKLFLYIRKVRPSIIHTHLFGADVFGAIAGRVAGCRNIISTEHNLNFSEGALKKLLKKIAAALRTHTVAISETVRRYAIEREGVSSRKSSVIYSGVAIKPLRRFAKGETLLIGAVGRLTRQKNFPLLVEAMSRIQDETVRCEIAGQGEDYEMLKNQINSLHLNKKVSLIGFQKDMDAFFNRINLLVMTSLWEGNPLALLEAGAAGVPVIASDIPSNKEIIIPDQDGILFHTIEELILAIKKLMADPQVGEYLANNFRTKVEKDFSLEKMIEHYYNLYTRLCQNVLK